MSPRPRRPAVRREMLTISDPRAMKALAHPARQRLLNELLAGRVITATEASELVGLSPSAVSHHLRALEGYGIAERVPLTDQDDQRTRLWRARVEDLNLTPTGPGGKAAAYALIHGHFEGLMATLLATSARDDPQDRESGFSVVETWLTRDERAEALTQLQAVLDAMPLRHSGDHPPDARRISFTVAHVPLSD